LPCVNAGGVLLLSKQSKTVCAFFTILAILGPAGSATSSTCACDVLLDSSPAVGGTPAEWNVYTNDEHEFRIRYPPTLDRTEVPSTLVPNGAVVSFVPEYDPSINEPGERTNLISFFLTIGVSDLEDAPEQETQAGAFADPQSRVCGPYPHFVRTCLSEGAAGNRYRTEVFATSFAGRRYEIALLVHSANPDCYPAGTITIFDCEEIAWLFETMVSSFSPSVEGAVRRVD
jgi:hypothetical protein